MKLGKAIVIIFAAISLVIAPVGLYYVADIGGFTLEIQGRLFNAKYGQDNGFGFFKFVPSGDLLFSTDAWNQQYTDEPIFGIQTGTIMMICWYVAIGLLLIGIVVAFFNIKISGIFFSLAFVVDAGTAITWFIGFRQWSANPYDLFFPIPVAPLFLLVTLILAFTSKKKESYYYSPGYSYGYGRR